MSKSHHNDITVEPLYTIGKATSPEGRKAYIAYATAMDDKNPKQTVHRGNAELHTYKNFRTPNVSIRDSYDQDDFDYFRPEAAIPTDPIDVISAVFQAYDKFSIVRSIIDLMSDFTVKGIDVVHPNPEYQTLGREWFQKVKGPERAATIAWHLFLAGVAPIRRHMGRIPSDSTGPVKHGALIPIRYTLLDPRSITPVESAASKFMNPDDVKYAVRISQNLSQQVSDNIPSIMSMVKSLPSVWQKALRDGGTVPMSRDALTVLHYKKPDYQDWPRPLIYPILRDLQVYEKLRLSDLSALDGATSAIRLWTLGDLDKEIYPTPDAISRLADMLLNNPGGGPMDLIWGPELSFRESSTEIHKFLGREKYAATLDAIFYGLGIHSVSGGDGNGTGLFVKVRTIIERLEYGRSVLQAFFLTELNEKVGPNLGTNEAYSLVYDQPVLSDETGEKKLLLEMVDRLLLSDEFVQERFGAIPEIERIRLAREAKLRIEGKLPAKAGPFHPDSRQKQDLERAFVNGGVLTPSQVGLEYPDPKPNELTITGSTPDNTEPPTPSGDKGGRPHGSPDINPRKKKRIKPRQSAPVVTAETLKVESDRAQVDKVIRPLFLKMKNKSSGRELSVGEANELEYLVTAVTCSLKSEPTPAHIEEVLDDCSIPAKVHQSLARSSTLYFQKVNRPLTTEETRKLTCAAIARYRCNSHQHP